MSIDFDLVIVVMSLIFNVFTGLRSTETQSKPADRFVRPPVIITTSALDVTIGLYAYMRAPQIPPQTAPLYATRE